MVTLREDLNFLNKTTFRIKKKPIYLVKAIFDVRCIYINNDILFLEKAPMKSYMNWWYYVWFNLSTAAQSPQISWIDVHLRHVKSLFNQQIKLEGFIHPHIILGLS